MGSISSLITGMLPDIDEPNTIEEIGMNLGGIAGAGMLLAGSANKIMYGAAYSIGAEPLVGELGFGYTVSNEGGFKYIKDSALSGEGGINGAVRTSNGQLNTNLGATRTDMVNRYNTRSIYSSAAGKGVQVQNWLSRAMPLGMSAYGIISSYADGGVSEAGKYMVSDILGNYYGTQMALEGYKVADAARAMSTLGITDSSGALRSGYTALAEGQELARISPIMGSGMLGRMLPVMGSIVMSTIGMEVGSSIGAFAGNVMGMNETIAGVLGGGAGAIGGAAMGAYMMTSLPGLIGGGIGLLATTATVKASQSILEAGFENIGKNKGLGYAGDTASYFTRNAVTMRERAVQAINKSHLNGRSAFGQEATIMHMNRDMFSQYKRY